MSKIKALWDLLDGKKTNGSTIFVVMMMALNYLGHGDLEPELQKLYDLLITSGVAGQIFGSLHKLWKAIKG